MKKIALAIGIAATLFAGAAQASSLETFVTTANRIPLNPTAMLRSDARRLMGQAQTAFRSVGAEHRASRAAGRPTASCPPEKVGVDPRQLLTHLNAIPTERRRRMTITDGIRDWMAARYPCPR